MLGLHYGRQLERRCLVKPHGDQHDSDLLNLAPSEVEESFAAPRTGGLPEADAGARHGESSSPFEDAVSIEGLKCLSGIRRLSHINDERLRLVGRDRRASDLVSPPGSNGADDQEDQEQCAREADEDNNELQSYFEPRDDGPRDAAPRLHKWTAHQEHRKPGQSQSPKGKTLAVLHRSSLSRTNVDPCISQNDDTTLESNRTDD